MPMKLRLSSYTQSILRALVSTLVPRHESFPPVDEDAIAYLEKSMKYLPFYLRVSMILGLYFLQFSPLILGFYFKPFTKMTPQQKERYVAAWATSRFSPRRDIIRGIRALCMIGAYSNPDILSHIGYTIDEHIRSRT